MSRLNLRTLYIYYACVNVWKPFMPCKLLQTQIPTIVSRIKCLPNSGPCQGVDRRNMAMPKLGTLDYLCEVGVRINVMPNTQM